MLKNKTQRFRRMSSAALIGLAIYGSSLSPAWANELKNSKRQDYVSVQRRLEPSREVTIGDGTVKSLGSDSMVVTREKDGKDFFVMVDSKTKVFEGFGKKGNLEQIKAGHKVFVKGKTLNGDSSTVLAKVMRDLSLRMRLLKQTD